MQTTKNTASLRSQHSVAAPGGAISLQNRIRAGLARGARIRGTANRYFDAWEPCAVFARSTWYGISSVPSRLLVTSQAAT